MSKAITRFSMLAMLSLCFVSGCSSTLTYEPSDPQAAPVVAAFVPYADATSAGRAALVSPREARRICEALSAIAPHCQGKYANTSGCEK